MVVTQVIVLFSKKALINLCTNNPHRIAQSDVSARGGGTLTLERGMGMCRGHDHLFSGRRSLAYQFTVNAPLLWPLFSIFRKILDFQPCFGQSSSSLYPTFSKFSFPRPPIFKESSLPRPYILKPAWYTSTKKKVECPPGVSATLIMLQWPKSHCSCLFMLALCCLAALHSLCSDCGVVAL